MKELEANLWKILLIRAIHMGLLMMPVIVVFWRGLGLGLSDIFALQVAFSVVMSIFEIPSGYLADILGRRRVLVFAYLLLCGGFSIFAFSSTFWGFVFGDVLLGIGVAFVSGTDMTLLFDTLKALGRETEFAPYQGRFVFYGQLSEAGAALIGGWLGGISIRLPLYVYSVQILFAAMLAFRLVEPPRETFARDAGHKENVSNIWRHVSRKPLLGPFLIFFSILGGSSLTAVWMYQEHWKSMDIPIVWFGPLWAAINLTVAFSARFAAPLREKIGREKALLLLPCLPAIGFMGMSLLPGLAGAACAGFIQMTRGFVAVWGNDEVNRLTGSEMRATVNSISSGTVRIVFCTVGLAAGMYADAAGIRAAFFACAFIFSAGAAATLWNIRRAQRAHLRAYAGAA